MNKRHGWHYKALIRKKGVPVKANTKKTTKKGTTFQEAHSGDTWVDLGQIGKENHPLEHGVDESIKLHPFVFSTLAMA